MAKRTKSVSPPPYNLNDSIVVYYEWPFGNDKMVPGDNIRIKNVRGTYKFAKVAHNMSLGVTWVDCMNNSTGAFHSFYVERIKLIIRPKKSRRKKQGVVN